MKPPNRSPSQAPNQTPSQLPQSQQQHPIIAWFISNPVSANLLMLGILLTGLSMVGFFGLFGMTTQLRLEAFPSLPPTTVTITASINGSTPEDVEAGITNKIEEAIDTVQGVEKTTSVSTSSSAIITVTAELNYDIDELYESLKSRVDAINGLPAEVENVIVAKEDFQNRIVWVSLYGDASERVLKREAERLKDRLLENPYVKGISLRGSRDDEIAIEVSETTLKEYQLTLAEIASAIANNSFDLATGQIDSSQGSVTLRIQNQAYQADDFANIIVRSSPEGGMTYLRDIAHINDGFVEQDTLSLFNGQPSISLRVFNDRDGNVIEADKAVKAITADFESTLPPNVKMGLWNNRVEYVRDRIDLFVRNTLTGVLLVFLLLTLFLNLRLAFWVAVGIPVSFCGALILMQLFDISISLLSLFGFILVLGIVVDDAIIIGESIYTQKKRENNTPFATINGVSRVSTAATFGVLTTVAAFLPLTTIDGRMGNLLGQIAFVVVFCLLFSLVESKLILPAHLHPIRVPTKPDNNRPIWERIQQRTAHGFEQFIEKLYLPLLTHALTHRYFCLLFFIALLILSIGLVKGGVIRQSFFPNVESQTISLTVEMDSNTNVDYTFAAMHKASEDLRTADQQLVDRLGLSAPNVTRISAYNQGDTTFSIFAGLAGNETRTIDAQTIANEWRQVVGAIEGAKSINFSARQRFGSADIEINLIGEDDTALRTASEALSDKLATFVGVGDIRSDFDTGDKEIKIDLKPEAEIYGISRAQVATAVRDAFFGREAQRVQRGKEETRVVVRYPREARRSLSDLYHLNIRTTDGRQIPIERVASLSFSSSPSNIEHINGQRKVSIYGNVDKSIANTDEILSSLTLGFLPDLVDRYGLTYQMGGEGEENAKSQQSMLVGLIVSLVSIYVLLAIPLKSYSKPFIIMSVIPFGIIGAILGHLILDMNLSMLSGFGIIALSGVVVNDSLLFISTIQLYRSEGASLYEAIRMTGVRRFRPIILTSVTTCAGLLPMLLETSFQAQFLIPMAVSLSFGIIFATTITLILVPTLYFILNDVRHLFFEASENTPKEPTAAQPTAAQSTPLK
ncbi:efflux RND transporter permease subunit [Ostreibacterium oceani]|uniref:Multidrug efflux pump subunit AcrB n=1 Tax=Ostreibacterium oceani TaxID=2654998 RepID=A0A6N7ESJ8_9GAMM|nr:efflux RND transporter permease subunit [Ostreibacterium oceani]MPV85472.1 hypothetical protein [Ostreibacterium oceani]